MLEEQNWLGGGVEEHLAKYSKESLLTELRRADSALFSSAPIFSFFILPYAFTLA